jgi:hypothetical protein
MKLVKEHPELEDRIFRALTNENRFLVARCLVALEQMKSSKLEHLPSEIFQRDDRIQLIYGSFGSPYTVGRLAREIVDKIAETKGEFMFDGAAVGIFVGAEHPKTPGLYRYEPYRSFAHYEVRTLLQKGEHPRCYYDCGRTRVKFTVRASPDYGVLELCEFEIESDQPA